MSNGNKSFGKAGNAAGIRRVPRNVSQAQAEAPPSAETEGTTLNTGAIATIGGLLIATLAGGYMMFEAFSSLPQSGDETAGRASSYVSSVDEFCREGWRKGQSNVDQMHCYLTSSTKRLCDREERAHLVAQIKLFERDYGAWERRRNAAAIGSIGKAQVRSLELGVASAGLGDPRQSAEAQAEQMEKVMKITGSILEGHDSVMAENVNKTRFGQLEKDLKELASDGLISEKDFGSSKPNWVTRGLKAAELVRPVCGK